MEGKPNPEKVDSDSETEEENFEVSELLTGPSSGFELWEDEMLDSEPDVYDILIIKHPVDESSAYHGDVASTSAVSDGPQPSLGNLPQRTSRSPSKRSRPSHQPTSDESDDPRDDPPTTMDDHHAAHRETGMECNHHLQPEQRVKKSVPRPQKRTTPVPKADDPPATRRSKKRGASESSSDADVEDNAPTTAFPFVPLPTIQEEVEEPVPAPTSSKKSKSKCLVCKKKLGLTAFPCRCGGVFCAKHRYDSEHDCSFDYRAMGAEEIRRNNPLVIAEKVPKL